MRKAHEIQEDQIANFTNNDDDPVTVDCLLCGADMTKMTSGKEHRVYAIGIVSKIRPKIAT